MGVRNPISGTEGDLVSIMQRDIVAPETEGPSGHLGAMLH